MGKLNVYAGVRFEYNRMELVSHTQKNEESPTSVFYTYDDFFPSVNAAYRLNDKHQFRLSYGRTVNRPNFGRFLLLYIMILILPAMYKVIII